jgi:hypothetical protein
VSGDTLPSGVYVVTLVAGKNNYTRYDITTAVITIVDTESYGFTYGVPNVEIVSLPTRLIPAGQPLRLLGTIGPTTTSQPFVLSNYTWSVSPALFNLTLYSIPIPAQYGILVDTSVFEPGIHYAFTLSASNEAGTSNSTVVILSQVPPESGRCSITALNTSQPELNISLYEIECVQWETYQGENMRTFQFGYVSGLTGRDVILTPSPSLWPQGKVAVPHGTSEVFVLIRGLPGQSHKRITFYLDTMTPLSVITDPASTVNPIMESWTAPYASYGDQEMVFTSVMTCLEWLNYQGQWLDSTNNISYPLWNTPIAYTDDAYEIAVRSAFQRASDLINSVPVPGLNQYSVRILSELYASSTNPTSANDANLLYANQAFPSKWMADLPLYELDSVSVTTLLEAVWNQHIAQQYVAFEPGQHAPLAQAITDLLNYLHIGLVNGAIENIPPSIYTWKDVHMIMQFGYSEDFVNNTVLDLAGVTVDLGSQIPKLYSTIAKTEADYAWGLIVLYQDTFLYEQSTQGISSPIVHVQVIEPSTQSLLTLTSFLDASTPVRLYLPELPIYNPGQLDIVSPLTQYCASWDSATGAWVSKELGFFGPFNTSANDPRPGCESLHLSEFAYFTELVGTDTNANISTDPGVGWWVYAGVLAALLAGICFMAALLVWRMRKKKNADKEAFVAPEMMGVTREDID